jgi:hypothetical protein
VTRLNGKEVQHTGIDDLIFDIPTLISYCSDWTPLVTGDVISTGMPEGVGFARKPPLWMKPGDVVEVEIDGGIGVLRTRLWPRADPGPKPMKAILLRRPGGPSALEYIDVPTPQPGEGRVGRSGPLRPLCARQGNHGKIFPSAVLFPVKSITCRRISVAWQGILAPCRGARQGIAGYALPRHDRQPQGNEKQPHLCAHRNAIKYHSTTAASYRKSWPFCEAGETRLRL